MKIQFSIQQAAAVIFGLAGCAALIAGFMGNRIEWGLHGAAWCWLLCGVWGVWGELRGRVK
jgi:hypothetical protein